MDELNNDTPDEDTTRDDSNERVQAVVDEHLRNGYVGRVPDDTPNSAYSLSSGPESPGGAPDAHTRVGQHSFPKEG